MFVLVGFALALLPGAAPAQDSVPPRPDYAPVARLLERFIAHEMADKDLPATASTSTTTICATTRTGR